MKTSSSQLKVPFTERTVMLSLVLYQILASYGSVSYWSYAVLFSYFASILVYCKILSGTYSFKNKIPVKLQLYFIFWLVVHILTNSHGDYIFPQNILLIIFYYFAFWIAITKDNIHVAIKYYSIVAWVCIGFFYIQEVSYSTMGFRIPGILPFLPYALHALDYNEFMYRLAASSRSASFFSEPAYFAQFLLPLLSLNLFKAKNRKEYLIAGFIGFTLLLTQSGTGIIALLAIVLVYIVDGFKKVSSKSSINILMTIVLLFGSVYIFLNTQMGEQMLSRQNEMSLNNEGGSRSGFMRIYRGFLLFGEYNIEHKLFGNDNDVEIARAKLTSSISNEFGENQDTFFNGASYCLLRTGFVGFILLFSFLFGIYKNNSPTGKAIILSFIFLMFFEAVFFANFMLLFIIFAQRIKESHQLNNLK